MELRETQVAEASYDNSTGLATLTAIKADFNKDGRGHRWSKAISRAIFDEAGTRRQLEAERAGAAS
jgi:hypothetical protein